MDTVTTFIASSFKWKDVLQSTASATKASVSVILVLLYGFLSRKYDFLTQETEDVSEVRAIQSTIGLTDSSFTADAANFQSIGLAVSSLAFV